MHNRREPTFLLVKSLILSNITKNKKTRSKENLRKHGNYLGFDY